MAKQSRQGAAWLGMAGHGGARLGKAGKAGAAWRGAARQGKAGIKQTNQEIEMAKQLTKAQFDVLRKTLKKNGQLTTSGILKAAEDEESPLHSMFTWDDTKAADEYRKMEARRVIKRYNVNVEDPAEQVVHVPAVKNGEGTYKETSVVVKNISEFELAMAEALSKLKAAELSVSKLHEVANKEMPDVTGVLAVAMQGLNTASLALDKIH